MAGSTYNAAELEVRRQLLREELATLETEKLKNLGGMQIVDFHHPERSPGWPIYRHQEWPRLMYHPTACDPRNEERRLGVRRRNEQNPHLAPMDVPDSEPLTVKVANETERNLAAARGFLKDPPAKQMIDQNSPLEMIGRGAHNPLLDSPASTPISPTLSVESIIKFNQMSKDELVGQAAEIYGVSLPDEASKVDIITAIQTAVQKGQSRAANIA
jgi:hypothetical protein